MITDSARHAAGMSAVHVIAGIGPQDGGPAYSVPRLCAALGGAGADVTLMSVAYRRAEANRVQRSGYRDSSWSWDYSGLPLLRGLRASSGLSRALRQEAARSNVFHDHGLWLMPNIYAGRSAREARIPLVVSPRGMLSQAALSFSPLKKKLFWKLLQGPAIRDAACFHATSQQEHDEIRGFGLNAPIAIIPNGIDIPAAAMAVPKKEYVLLSLGRIHPKKGLDRLLHAWAKLECLFPDWRLHIAGPGEGGHEVELKTMVQKLGLVRVSIEGPVYGDAKDALMRETDLFVLPTLNENFALTVAEALAHGVPVISTKGAPWSRLESEGCGWWVDHGPAPLAAALDKAMTLPSETRRQMGVKGRAWMAREFSWARIASDMLDVYGWLSGDGARPATIRTAC